MERRREYWAEGALCTEALSVRLRGGGGSLGEPLVRGPGRRLGRALHVSARSGPSGSGSPLGDLSEGPT